MDSLLLNNVDMIELNAVLEILDQKFGTKYNFTPEESEFSCSCSGPAESCIWH